MYTFRGHHNEPMHSHRLLYLHASQKDYNLLNLNQRVKTQTDTQTTSDVEYSSALRTIDQEKRLNRCSTYSTRKIKYFDLDLKSLTQSSQTSAKNTAALIQSHSLRGSNQNNSKTKVFNSEKKPYFFSKQVLKNQFSEVNSRLLQSSVASQKNPEKKQGYQNLLNLLDKENLQELWESPPLNQAERIKQVRNNKDIAIKYNKFKQNQKYIPKPFVKPNIYKDNKKILKKEDTSRLFVKKIEKLLEDKNGNEYKVTIERV